MDMVYLIPPSQRRIAFLAAQADSAPVLIHGGQGSGKGAIARWIHQNGPRAAAPLLEANHQEPLVAQIPRAQGGTLVISEISEWPLGEQRVLLDFLQHRAIPHPMSSDMRMLINVRIIATTSHALDARAQGGLFNSDLLEKFSAYRIEMPPLAARSDEFDDIVLVILNEITRELHKEHLRELDSMAWLKLKGYEWPGNLRELRNVLKLGVVAALGERIEGKDLPEFGHDRVDFRTTREVFEKTYILEILKNFDSDLDRACEVTQLDKELLLAKMKKYGIPLSPTI